MCSAIFWYGYYMCSAIFWYGYDMCSTIFLYSSTRPPSYAMLVAAIRRRVHRDVTVIVAHQSWLAVPLSASERSLSLAQD